jgi:hypothetical protein
MRALQARYCILKDAINDLTGAGSGGILSIRAKRKFRLGKTDVRKKLHKKRRK